MSTTTITADKLSDAIDIIKNALKTPDNRVKSVEIGFTVKVSYGDESEESEESEDNFDEESEDESEKPPKINIAIVGNYGADHYRIVDNFTDQTTGCISDSETEGRVYLYNGYAIAISIIHELESIKGNLSKYDAVLCVYRRNNISSYSRQYVQNAMCQFDDTVKKTNPSKIPAFHLAYTGNNGFVLDDSFLEYFGCSLKFASNQQYTSDPKTIVNIFDTIIETYTNTQ
jgi:hypothetical protein